MTELEVARRLGLQLLYWKRVGNDPNEWKGPHAKGWNDPERIYDFAKFDPAIHNVGVFTGREVAKGQYVHDVDFDKLIGPLAKAFFPDTNLALARAGKPLSHAFYLTSSPLPGRVKYDALSDNKPYVELRGLRLQTMFPPSLHTPPDVRVGFVRSTDIARVESLSVLQNAVLDYSIAHLLHDVFPSGLHHDERLALAGYLLQFDFNEGRLTKLLQTVCQYQTDCGVPDMSDYDVKDSQDVVTSTAKRLKNKETVRGWQHLNEVNGDFAKRLALWLGPAHQGRIAVQDFYAYMPTHTYLFIPSREFWPGSSVNARIPAIPHGTDDKGKQKTVEASVWLDRHRAVEQMTWAPGLPMLIRDRLVSDGGWIERAGCSCVNLYRAPQITPGDPDAAGPWLELVRRVYPDDADHLLAWFAHRVQRPHEKVNHALVIGGVPGIGKDTILEPVKAAVGPWNCAEVSPKHLLGRFNGFVKSVILRISEARDLGEMSRYDFYEHMKVYTAAPPDVLRVDEKNIREYSVFNVCGVVITTNHETDGIYLPPEDRRHYVTWSGVTADDFDEAYWKTLYAWYANGGASHVAAYLAAFDLSYFDPKAPPKKTEAFWAIVDANRSTEDAELADVIEELEKTSGCTLSAVTLQLLADVGSEELKGWLRDRKNARQVPHRMKTAGYVPYRNPAAKDGLWKIDGKRQVIYVRSELAVPQRQAAAEYLTRPTSEAAEAKDDDRLSY